MNDDEWSWGTVVVYVCVVAAGVGAAAYLLDRRRKSLPQAYTTEAYTTALNAATATRNIPTAPSSAAVTTRGAAAATCGCVFDLDGTLTHGAPAKTVALCKARGCALGINTARRVPYAADVPLREHGFPDKVDFYYNSSAAPENVAPRKVAALERFRAKWGIREPSRVLFFDDDPVNVRSAAAAGFTAIQCSEPGWAGGGARPCGIGPRQEAAARHALSRPDSVTSY